MSSLAAAKAAQAGSRVIGVEKKYTVQSYGIWERIRRVFAVDPTRSNGVPLNPQFRNPPPGALDPLTFDDPVTFPAGDIADNAYWKRDVRRGYARASVVNQADVVGLLSVGNAAKPKKELIGEEGVKALIAAKQEGEQLGLAAYFKKQGGMKSVLDERGLPPLPSGASMIPGGKKYDLTPENAYPEQYTCRTFV